MSILFEPMHIKNMVLRNRFVRSATGDGGADEAGHVTEKQINMFEALAEGGVGLIVTGISYVDPSGQLGPTQNSIAGDDCIPGFRRLTSAVHDRGAKIAIQLFHGGRESARFLKNGDTLAGGPSLLEEDPYFPDEFKYTELTDDDIWRIIGAYGDAAKRAREAGFDAVQLHGAHAYLLSQFLSPYTNRRGDDWGGSLENRVRLHREIFRDIRKKVGEDYPILIKIGVQDGFDGGLEISEGKRAAQLLAKWGYEALEISQGLRGKWFEGTEFRTGIDRMEREAYFRDWCRDIKGDVNVPMMMVGGLRSFEVMEEVIKNNEADFISMCRPFIREPGIVKAWKSGKRNRSTCISCNKCLGAFRSRQFVRCIQEETEEA